MKYPERMSDKSAEVGENTLNPRSYHEKIRDIGFIVFTLSRISIQTDPFQTSSNSQVPNGRL